MSYEATVRFKCIDAPTTAAAYFIKLLQHHFVLSFPMIKGCVYRGVSVADLVEIDHVIDFTYGKVYRKQLIMMRKRIRIAKT